MSKILIVEDEAITAMDLEEIISGFGHQVVATADNAKSAIYAAEEHQPDLILMDINIKGDIDGVTAASELKRRGVDCAVIFLTSYSDEATIGRAKLINPAGYILKPYQETDLKITIDFALNAQSKTKEPAQLSSLVNTDDAHFEAKKPRARVEYKWTTAQFIGGMDIFSEITPELADKLGEHAYYRTVKSKEVIINQNEDDLSAIVPVSTTLSLIKYTSKGKEIITDILEPGNPYLMILAMFHNQNGFVAQANTDGLVLQISKEKLANILVKQPNIYESFSEFTVNKLQESEDFLKMVAYESVETRIAYVLTKLCSNLAKYDFNTDIYKIAITRMELASLVGTTQETAIRLTRKLEDRGILKLSSPGLIEVVKIEELEKLVSS